MSDYSLHTLGWKNFQDLCGTVLREVMGQTFKTFAPGADGGRDGAFKGRWVSQSGESLSGQFVAQCKHTSKSDARLSLDDVRDELPKVSSLSSKGLLDSYLLITNASVSGKADAQIVNAIQEAGAKDVQIMGGEVLAQLIKENVRLRMLVPRIYGLGDLTQILDARMYAQGFQVLESIKEDLKRFVITKAYIESARALEKHGFVILVGDPGSGKTMIANTLILHATDRWKALPMKLNSAEDFKAHWNPEEHVQLMHFDDAFGAYQYEAERARLWDRAFPELAAAIRSGLRVIFTSRNYIFKQALRDVRVDRFPLIRDSNVVVKVEELSVSEKEDMLYNHLKLGDQSKAFKSQTKSFLPLVAAKTTLRPELAQRLGWTKFTQGLQPQLEAISDYIDNPKPYLREVIDKLSPNERAALVLIFHRGGSLKGPLTLEEEEHRLLELLGSSLGGVKIGMHALDGSLLRRLDRQGVPLWIFRHPTTREAVGDLLADDPDLSALYLRGAPADKLLSEITCGDVGLEGVRIAVKPDSFPHVANRIAQLIRGDRYAMRAAYVFLVDRCTRAFLEYFIQREPGLFDAVAQLGGHVEDQPLAFLLARYHREGLLDERVRLCFVARVLTLAVLTPDASCLARGDLRDVLVDGEEKALVAALRGGVVAQSDTLAKNWELDPDDVVGSGQPLEDTFRAIRSELESAGDGDGLALLDGALEILEERMREDDHVPDIESDFADEVRRDDDDSGDPVGRSRFDDLDE